MRKRTKEARERQRTKTRRVETQYNALELIMGKDLAGNGKRFAKRKERGHGNCRRGAGECRCIG